MFAIVRPMDHRLPKPDPFLEVRVHLSAKSPSLCGLCVGYERRRWRAEQFASHIFEWLPEFALSPKEYESFNLGNSVRFMRRAVLSVYESKKFKNRGEFGELFLHAIIRQVHDSIPAISKLYLKTGANDTVKGFDAVHVVGPAKDLELWLGEAKFYKSIPNGVRAVVKELGQHLAPNYLKKEFLLIRGKIDADSSHGKALDKLLSPNTSLDQVFKRVCIPILLTYDSVCLKSFKQCTDEYIDAFRKEMSEHYDYFADKLATKKFPEEIRFHLFLLPLSTKAVLIKALDKKLRTWQQA